MHLKDLLTHLLGGVSHLDPEKPLRQEQLGFPELHIQEPPFKQ